MQNKQLLTILGIIIVAYMIYNLIKKDSENYASCGIFSGGDECKCKNDPIQSPVNSLGIAQPLNPKTKYPSRLWYATMSNINDVPNAVKSCALKYPAKAEFAKCAVEAVEKYFNDPNKRATVCSGFQDSKIKGGYVVQNHSSYDPKYNIKLLPDPFYLNYDAIKYLDKSKSLLNVFSP